jgi:UDP-3-O-[3-hydroxymyristoyl] glucosamine N-acyltransferase
MTAKRTSSGSGVRVDVSVGESVNVFVDVSVGESVNVEVDVPIGEGVNVNEDASFGESVNVEVDVRVRVVVCVSVWVVLGLTKNARIEGFEESNQAAITRMPTMKLSTQKPTTNLFSDFDENAGITLPPMRCGAV